MKTIITGTGRSGTTLIHKVLTELGADVGTHEKCCGKDGAVGGYGVLKNFIKPYEIITQMRHPLDTVNSVLASSPSDFPELGLIKTDYSTIELYTLQVWNTLHTILLKQSKYAYTLENLNNGEAADMLIQVFKIDTTPETFNQTVINISKTKARNSRPRRSIITAESLISQNKSLYYNSLEMYNTLNNANTKA